MLKVPLDMQKDGYQQIPKIEDSLGILIVVYPVYAFDAPNLVYDWINKVSNGTSLPCAVISVSGGGETWPNLSCRAGIIKLLSEKGFNVFYERMFVMPSNVFFQTKDQLAIQIINILPKKVEHCVNEIVLGVKRRKEYSNSKERKQSKKNMQDFGKILDTNNHCTSCGWCADNCPTKNIEIIDSKPEFKDRCLICLRCVYGCPANALYPKKFKFLLVKGGYSLAKVEKKNGR